MSVFGIIILVLAVVFIYLFNGLLLKRSAVDNHWIYLVAVLKKRNEMLMDLQEKLQETFPDLAQKAAESTEAFSPRLGVEKMGEFDAGQTALLKKIFAPGGTAENNQSLQDLAGDFNETESTLVLLRSCYNKEVSNLNNVIAVPAFALLARAMKISARETFAMPAEEWCKAAENMPKLFK